MKRTIAVIFITIALLISGIIEIIFVKEVMKNLGTSIISIEEKFKENKNNITIIEEDVNKLYQEWQEKEVYLCLMFNHKDLSAITDGLNKLQTNTKLNNYDEALTELMLLKLYSENRIHLMGFNLQNIL